jgi:hypothetical protein
VLLLEGRHHRHQRFDAPGLDGLWVAELLLGQSMPGRMTRPAALFVGFTPAWRTNVHKAWRTLKISRHTPSLVGTPHFWPASSNRSTSRRTAV